MIRSINKTTIRTEATSMSHSMKSTNKASTGTEIPGITRSKLLTQLL